MSQLYRALHNSQIKKYGSEEPTENTTILEYDNDHQSLSLEAEMRELQYNIELAIPHIKKKIIQFIGARAGEGTSTIAREYVRFCAKDSHQSVLLLQLRESTPSPNGSEKNQPAKDLDVAIQEGTSLEEAIVPMDLPSLFFSRFGSSLEARTKTTPSTDLWQLIRERYDLVLVDTPSVSSSTEGLRICSKADGIILVVEAENTRSLVAHHAKNQILRAKGNLLGLVFNKQHHRIPAWIYQQL